MALAVALVALGVAALSVTASLLTYKQAHGAVESLLRERLVLVQQLAAIAGRPIIYDRNPVPEAPVADDEEPDFEWKEP